jgi:magnesium chelatase subunit I
MNPEEGELRPQIMDRFGLRIWVAPLSEREDRLELYRRVRDFRAEPELLRRRYASETEKLRDEVMAAREVLPYVTIAPEAEQYALRVIEQLHIPSHRAEIALLESSRARAAADYRAMATIADVRVCAALTLRLRRSLALEHYAESVAAEDATIAAALATADGSIPVTPVRRARAKRTAARKPQVEGE